MTKRLAFLMLFFLALSLTWPALAHALYLSHSKEKLIYKNIEYTLVKWTGEGTLFSDPMRAVVVRRDNGAFVAVSPHLGSEVAWNCPAIESCHVYTFAGSGLVPRIAQVDPQQMREKAQPLTYLVDPQDSKEAFGFADVSGDYLQWPLAWLHQEGFKIFLLICVLCGFCILAARKIPLQRFTGYRRMLAQTSFFILHVCSAFWALVLFANALFKPMAVWAYLFFLIVLPAFYLLRRPRKSNASGALKL